MRDRSEAPSPLVTSDPGLALRDGSRDSSRPVVTRACPSCGGALPSARARSRSHACRQRAFRPRQPGSLATPDLPKLDKELQRRQVRVAHTVYECPNCEQWYLGERRCAACNTFCRALGLGGTCVDCDAVILVAELLEGVLP